MPHTQVNTSRLTGCQCCNNISYACLSSKASLTFWESLHFYPFLITYTIKKCSARYCDQNFQIMAAGGDHNVTGTSEILGMFHSSVCLCCMFLGSVSRDGPPGPSPELLASLQSLRENSDYTLLPHSLHQVCACVFVSVGASWSIFFLPNPEGICLFI